MILQKTLLFICTLIFATGCNPQFEEGSIFLKNVQVLTMESDEIISNQTIVINPRGDISWVGSSDQIQIPEEALTIDGNGRYLMPGLAEMHAHIPGANQGEEYIKAVLGLYLSQGITTIRGMLGQQAHLEMREMADNGLIDSPRIFTSGPSFSGNSVSNPDQVRERVREQHEAEYDLLKLHPGLTLELFNALADEANQSGIEFSGHISHAVGLERSLKAGQGTIDHLDRYMEFLAGNPEEREDPSIIYFGYDLAWDADESLIEEAARMTKEAGVWNVPTNTLMVNVFSPDYTPEEMDNWPGMEYIPQNTRQGWINFVTQLRGGSDYDADKARQFLELRDKLTLALHNEGAGLLLGADAPQIFNPPGYSAHRELELLVKAGLSPYEALKTGTVNVGVYLNEENQTGKIAPGFRADLILLSDNPLQAIPFHDHIEGVMMHGIYYDRDLLDGLLQNVLDLIN